MKMRRGITLHNQLRSGYDAITINSGTVFHKDMDPPEVNYRGMRFRPLYEEFAYVTKRDWRKLQAGEIRTLKANGNRRDYNTVFVGDIPENLKELFISLDLTNCTSRPEVLDKFAADPKKTAALSERMQEFLTPLSNGKPFHFHCIGINLPNIEMVACDTTRLPPNFKEQDKRFMGIHNDGTQYMTLHTTYKFGNRISINLGKETRSFFFVNLTMIQALNMLKQKIDVKKQGVDIHNVPRHFFKHFPDYPVIKIQQEPYQYYIAPTDNCFHDGSTLGNSALDITIVYFGAFQC